MKKIFIVALLIILWRCTPQHYQTNDGPIYLYDSAGLLRHFTAGNDTLKVLVYKTSISILNYYKDSVDTFLIGTDYKYYELEHYYKYNDYKDTFFKKHKSFLDSIKYFDDKWLQDEAKLDSFWKPVTCWRCSGIYDTVKIYLVLPIKGTDSVIVRQVHRFYHESL